MMYYCFSICYMYSVHVCHVGLLQYHLKVQIYHKYEHKTSQKLVLDLYKIYL